MRVFKAIFLLILNGFLISAGATIPSLCWAGYDLSLGLYSSTPFPLPSGMNAILRFRPNSVFAWDLGVFYAKVTYGSINHVGANPSDVATLSSDSPASAVGLTSEYNRVRTVSDPWNFFLFRARNQYFDSSIC